MHEVLINYFSPFLYCNICFIFTYLLLTDIIIYGHLRKELSLSTFFLWPLLLIVSIHDYTENNLVIYRGQNVDKWPSVGANILGTHHCYSGHTDHWNGTWFWSLWFVKLVCLRMIEKAMGLAWDVTYEQGRTSSRLGLSGHWGGSFPEDAVVKNPPANAGDKEIRFWSLCWKDPLEKEMATHSCILAWKIPCTEEHGRL